MTSKILIVGPRIPLGLASSYHHSNLEPSGERAMMESNRMEMLRVLMNQMELDLRDEAPPPQPAISLELMRELSESRLWPLHAEPPLAAELQQRRQARATLVWQDDSPEANCDATLEVVIDKADDGQTIELTSDQWPAGWKPLAIVLGRFDDGPRFEPAGFRYVVERPRQRQESADESTLVLAARKMDAGSLMPKRFSSPDLDCYYHAWDRLLEVSARLPAGGLAVAEMSYTAASGQRLVQRRLVDLRISAGERWKGEVRFYPPDQVPDHELRFLVRPYSASDLDLLSPDAIRDVLADADFASMQMHAIPGGFRFRPLLPHQEQWLADPEARWCLRMVRAGGEGVTDV
jgi:hypothetical protein